MSSVCLLKCGIFLIFTVDYSITWTGHLFWLRIFPFTWLGVLILTADFSVDLIRRTDVPFTWFGHTDSDYWFLRLKWGARRVRPVGRGCLLLQGTWPYLWYIQRSVYAHSLISISYFCHSNKLPNRTPTFEYPKLFMTTLPFGMHVSLVKHPARKNKGRLWFKTVRKGVITNRKYIWNVDELHENNEKQAFWEYCKQYQVPYRWYIPSK
jgi:hypothetical protein